MAKQTTTTPSKPSANTAPLVPIETDPRTEFMWLVGKAGYECNPRMAERMMELFVILTRNGQAPAPETGE